MHTYKAILKIFADIELNDTPKDALRPHHKSQKDATDTAPTRRKGHLPESPPTTSPDRATTPQRSPTHSDSATLPGAK